MTFYVRAPDHLGDGVMALPAIAALRRRGGVTVDGPPWSRDLYAHLGVRFGPPRPREHDVAVLLKPSFSAAWRALRVRRRIGRPTDHRGLLLTVPVPDPRGHRTAEFAAVAAAAGAWIDGPPSLPGHVGAAASMSAAGRVLVCPGTRSPTVAWPGLVALAAKLGPDALVVGGPGDEAAVDAFPATLARLCPVDIATFATLAREARAVVAHDSGLAHLAAAARRGVGLDVSAVHVVYGSTDPERTGPPGTTPHHGSRPNCWPCYRKSCPVGLLCLDAPVAQVADALTQA